MKKHVAWQPHVEAELLLNPFIPPEWRLVMKEVDLDETYRDEIRSDEDAEEAC